MGDEFKKEVYLLIGGNLGDRSSNLREAVKKISQECGTILQISSVYATAAWGKTDQPPFLNQCLRIETPFPPLVFIKRLLKIEQDMGRVRQEKYGARTIDIDVLYYEKEILHTPELVVPHPRIAERRFALIPMAEINEAFVDPLKNMSIRQMLDICPDPLEVKMYSEDV
jgi:2-amino-4-hydroxy-6-hydroxymethyldihydropteridine diphosphokinase